MVLEVSLLVSILGCDVVLNDTVGKSVGVYLGIVRWYCITVVAHQLVSVLG